MSDTANPNPDWYPDPTGRFEQRYWDGSQWTEHVTSAGQQRVDPLPGGPVEPVQAAAPVESGPEAPRGPEAQAAAEPAATGPAPDWYPDPTGRYDQRYWDGTAWTGHVTAAGQQGLDPLPDEAAATASEGEPGAAAEPPSATEPEPAAEPPSATAEPEPAAETTAEPEPAAEPPSDTEPEPAAEPVNPFAAAGEPAGSPGGYVVNDEGQLVPREAGDATSGGGSIPVADSGPPPVEPIEPTEDLAVAPGQAAAAPAEGGPPPDWYPDPTGRQELRYWDGAQWTEHASTAGRQVVDPLA